MAVYFKTIAMGKLIFRVPVMASSWGGGSRISPLPLYPSSGKRHQLPYHPVARFKGADTRSYYQPLDLADVQDYFSSYSPGTSRWWMAREEQKTSGKNTIVRQVTLYNLPKSVLFNQWSLQSVFH